MYVKIVLICLFAFIIQRCFQIYTWMHFGRKVFNHYPGPCQRVNGIGHGSENMFMQSDGIVFITSGFSLSDRTPKYREYYAKNSIKGGIYMVDLKNPKTPAQEMSLSSNKDFDKDNFYPHGISGWQDKQSGKLYLFVVNHERSGKEKVEKFLVSMGTKSLTHVKSFDGDGLFTTLNDVAATGPESFYFTNSASLTSSFGRMFEILMFLPWSNVGYYDGTRSRQVLGDLLFANGIDMSLDGRYVYVLSTNNLELQIFNRKDDDSLDLHENYKFDGSLDNVVVDPTTGDLYVSQHTVTHLVFAHLDDPEERAPSQILHIKLKNGLVSTVSQLFADDGNLITAATVAAVFKKKMIIGSIIDSTVICDITVPM